MVNKIQKYNLFIKLKFSGSGSGTPILARSDRRLKLANDNSNLQWDMSSKSATSLSKGKFTKRTIVTNSPRLQRTRILEKRNFVKKQEQKVKKLKKL